MTLTAEHWVGGVPIPSSLTTAVPPWCSEVSTQSYGDHLRPAQSARRDLMVYMQGAHLPRWVGDHLNAKLHELFMLPPGWDGSSADEVTVEAVSETLAVLATIINDATIAPQFFPLADGGIQIEWHVGGNDIEIEINGAGSAYILAVRSTGETVVDAEVRAIADDSAIRAVATFLNELSTRPGLAQLLGDVSSPNRGSFL